MRIIRLFIDFLKFYRIYNDFTKTKLTKKQRGRLATYDYELEKDVVNQLNDRLCTMLLRWEVSAEFVNWFKICSNIRLALINRPIFPEDEK